MHKTEKETGFFWHWQNLKNDWPKAKLHGRAWLHKRPRGIFGIEWVLPSRSFHIGVTVSGVEDQLRFSVNVWLFALYLSFEQWPWLNRWKAAKDYYGKRTDFSIHHWAFWWHMWADEHEWKSTTPKWHDGSFHINDFFLGKNKYTKVDQEPIPVVISMPEGEYPATVTFFTQTWKRPRWPWSQVKHGGDVDIPGGIPTPGKGENSWDCEDDAYLSIGTSASTIEEAIQDAIQTVNKRREHYGGKNWLPVREK